MRNDARAAAILAILLLSAPVLSACDKPVPEERAGNPEKYDRDASACREQVDQAMRTRRNIDNSRRESSAETATALARARLPEQMDAYSDAKSTDRVMSDCMASRGWSSSSSEAWWKKIGQPHTF